MNRITLENKEIDLDFDTEQIYLQDSSEEDYPYITVYGNDQDGNEYQLIYATTESYRKMARKILGDKKLTPKLTRLTLDLYEQLTHLNYCEWRKPESYGVI